MTVTRLPSLRDTLVGHRDRLRDIETAMPGRWVYVVNVAGPHAGDVFPATTPVDFIAGDPYSPEFQNGITNVLGGQAVSFRIHPATRVALRGDIALNGAALPVVAYTLPAGFLPAFPAPIVWPSQDGTLLYSGRVDANGDVWILQSFS